MNDANGGAFPDGLLASCVNGGGVFVVADGVVEQVSPVDTTGIAIVPGGAFWARQAEGVAELRRLRGPHLESVVLMRESLDLHDVLVSHGRLYVVATELNTVFELDVETYAETRRWTLPGERDSQHVNSVCVHRGRILASRFGVFAGHRGYKGQTRRAGEVVDLETGEIVITGLSQPHSLRSIGGRLWLCNSEAHAVHAYRDFVLEVEIPVGGYARGLAFSDRRIYVGISRTRNDERSSVQGAQVASFDLAGLQGCGRVLLPVDEVYDLVTFGVSIDEVRQAGLAEALQEVREVRHARNLAASARVEAVERVTSLENQLDALVAAVGDGERRIASLGLAFADAADRAAEGALWSARQQQAIDELQAQARMMDAAREASETRESRLLQAIRDVGTTRSWRWTRWLRGKNGRDITTLLLDHDGTAGTDAALLAPPRLPDRASLPILGLAFVEHADPLVSIVVASYGEFGQTLACLQSIQRAGDEATFEVILVEDASADRDMGRFAHVPGLQYIANPVNLGYLRSVNKAASTARGEYLHLLNNDTRVVPGWLDALLTTFARFDACGMVGPKLLYPDGTLQEAGGIVWSDGTACNYGRGDDPGNPAHAVVREVDYVSGAALLLRTRTFAELGGYDERYLPAYYEDTDLAFRVRDAGARVYVQPDAVVIHHEGLSHGTDPAHGIKRSQVTNRGVFLARWQRELADGQCAAGEHVFLARDRAQLARMVLVVDRYPPRTDRDAGSRAMWQLMRVLHQRGVKVKFWSDEPRSDPGYLAALRKHGIEVFDEATDGPFEEWISAHGCYFDHVILSRPLVARRYVDAVREHCGGGLIYYGHDIHHQRMRRQAALDAPGTLFVQAEQVRQVEEALWAEADLVLYPSSEETREVASYLRTIAADGIARTIPLFAFEGVAPAVEARGAAPAERDTLLFVGGFSHAPNTDAVVWFVDRVWPRLVARHPGLQLWLAGGDAGPDVLALASESVMVTGAISEPELLDAYRRARVAIAPLRFGAGLKGKVIEAMWRGVPCVTTTVGQQGLSEAGSLRIADEPEAMAEAISVLLDDDEAWWEASRSGQAYAAEHFSVDTVWHALAGLIEATEPPPTVAARLERMARARRRTPLTSAMPPHRTSPPELPPKA